MMEETTRTRITLFLIFAFSISWGTAGVIYLTGGLSNSPVYNIENAQISLAYILLATGYMFGPAVANILTRMLTHEGTQDLYLRPNFDNKRWIFYLAAWFSPGALELTGNSSW